MPRIAEGRRAAEPSSPEQKARYRKILRVAAALAEERGLDRVQMHEVAKGAGVAIATLYRYFPSKTQLFTAVMTQQVEYLEAATSQSSHVADPVEAVFRMLRRATRDLLSRPLLARAMMQANNASRAATVSDVERIDTLIQVILLRMLGLEEPTAQDEQLVRLLEECWYGVLISALNGRTSMLDAEAEIRLACSLLLAARSNAPQPVDPR